MPLVRRAAAQLAQQTRLAWTVMNNMMDTIDFSALAGIGLGAGMRAQLAFGVADPAARPMRLVEIQRDHLLLHDGQDAHRARCDSTLSRDLHIQGEALAVGDWVLARPGGGAGWAVACRLLPRSQITRRVNDGRSSDGRSGVQRQALVSNVDTALLVMGLDADFNLRRLERYAALVLSAGATARADAPGAAGVAVVLVLSKADTVDAALLARRRHQALGLLPPGTAVLALDVRQPSAAQALAPWLGRGQTLVLLGSSGAGKSSLCNALQAAFAAASGPGVRGVPGVPGGPSRLTGGVRADDSRGRHTTTVRTLLPLPGAACIIDTPGLRALRLDLDDADDLAAAFEDVARWSPMCQFRDCRHQHEPGCAVRDSVPEPRLRNYHKLLRETQRDGPGLAERQAQRRAFKARSRNAQIRIRAKREAGA